MKRTLMSIMASGLLLAAPAAALAQAYPNQPSAPAVEGGPMDEPAGPTAVEPAPVPMAQAPLGGSEIILPEGQVRIVIVDPAAAAPQIQSLAQSGELDNLQARVTADPVLSAQLAAANIPTANVFDMSTDIDGTTTLYASG